MLEREYPGGIDVAYEGVGGRLREAVLQHLTPTGRLLGVGYISSYPHTSGYRDPGAPPRWRLLPVEASCWAQGPLQRCLPGAGVLHGAAVGTPGARAVTAAQRRPWSARQQAPAGQAC